MSRAIRIFAKSEADRDHTVIDQSSPVVFAVGAVTAFFGLKTETVLLGALLFEVGQAWPPTGKWMRGTNESLANKLGDFLVFTGGYYLGSRLKALG